MDNPGCGPGMVPFGSPGPGRCSSALVRSRLRAQVLHHYRTVPEAAEAIRYGMPSFNVGGATIVYFAIWKKHVGFYPIYRGDAAFEEQISAYREKIDTVQFPLGQPMPLDLITSIVNSQLQIARKSWQ